MVPSAPIGLHSRFFSRGIGLNGIWDWTPVTGSFRLGPAGHTDEGTLPEFLQVVHPEDQYTVRTGLESCAAGQSESWSAHIRIADPVASPGGWTYVEFHGRAITGAGQPRPVTGVCVPTQADLSRRLNELETIYKYVPVGLCLFDRDLRWVRINELLARANGYSPAQHVGRKLEELLPEAAPEAVPQLRRVLETGEPMLDVKLTMSTGGEPGIERVWNENWVPLKNDAGEVIGVNVVAQEITAQRRAEEELRHAAEHLRKVLDSLFVFVAVTTPEGILLEVNRAPLDATGVTLADVLNRPFWEAPWWTSSGAEQQQFRESIRKGAAGESSRYDLEIQVAAGPMSVDFSLNPLRDAGGNVTHLICSAVDISGRKRAEQELRTSKDTLELAQIAGGVGIFDWDFVHDTSTVSPQWLRIYGLPEDRQHPTHQDWLRTVHPEDRERAQTRALNAAVAGEPYSDQFRVVWADGSVHWIESTARSWPDEKGRPARFIGTARDITDRRHHEIALRESEERFRTAVNIFPHGFILYDDERRFVFLNDWALRLLNRAAADVVGRRLEEVQPAELTAICLPHLQRAYQTRQTQTFEWTLPDGYAPRTLIVTFAPLLDEAGGVRQMLAVMYDITDRKNAEAALAVSEMRRRLALQAASMYSFVWDIAEDRASQDGYPAFLRSAGPGRNLAEVIATVHPEDREAFRDRVERTLQNPDEPYRSEFRILTDAGDVRYLSEWGLLERAPDGRPLRLTGVTQDITETRVAELSLRDSREQLRALIEAIPGIVFITDARGKYTFANRFFQDYAGLAAEEILGYGWIPLTHPEDLERSRTIWKQAVATGGIYESEMRLRRADGAYRWFVCRGLPMRDEDGQIRLWLGIAADIDEQKKTEDALRRSNNSLQQFAYIASHDLQEPLRTVGALSELVARRYQGKLDAEADKLLTHIVSAARRMSQLIQDLLLFSRASSEEMQFSDSVSIASVIETNRSELQAAIQETGASIAVEGELPEVRGDASQLRQVFQNLLLNAMRYARTGLPPQIRIRARSTRGWTIIAVHDNGQGFERDQSERIFAIFQRLHGREVPGNGIGLAIVRLIVERHGGRVWATGRPGEGATFYVQLPLVDHESSG